MGNKNIFQYYDKLAKKITDPKETRNKAKDFSKYDINLMRSLAGKDMNLLDLGSGTGLLINNLIDDFKQITAVEKYPEFSKFITQADNLEIINQDLLALDIPKTERYDVVSLFGVMNYFDGKEAEQLYRKIKDYIKKEGVLVVKNQFGINEDVIVNGYSEELKADYYSEYRHVEKEKRLLKETGFSNIETIDIYPPEYNRWDNTHFYALVCRF